MEACRRRTRGQCAKEFLSVAIPQKFKINADNFSRDFYEPMMESLQNLYHLSALFMKDSSNLHLDAFKNKLCNLDLSKIKRKPDP